MSTQNVHLAYSFFTPFVPWQNQMDPLWPQVRKLELVPTQKKHQLCHFMSFLVWVTNNYNTKIGNRGHSICNLWEIYNIPVNHWNFKSKNEQHEHGIALPLTNWQPWQQFHASQYSFEILCTQSEHEYHVHLFALAVPARHSEYIA